MSETPSSGSSARFHILPAVAAWVVPGLGHVLLGDTRRGVILGVTIGTLWFGGLLLGGVGVFDWDTNRLGGLGQMLIGPSIVLDYYHQRIETRFITGGLDPASHPFYEPPIGRMQEQGVLYTAMAGLLNFLVIIDVVYREAGEKTPAG